MKEKTEYAIVVNGKRQGVSLLSKSEVEQLLKLGYKKGNGKILLFWS